jgi:hypothetical protein
LLIFENHLVVAKDEDVGGDVVEDYMLLLLFLFAFLLFEEQPDFFSVHVKAVDL